MRVGSLPRPGRAQPLCGLAALGHLRLQHRAGPLSAAATSGASGLDRHCRHTGDWCPPAATRPLGTRLSAVPPPCQDCCRASGMRRGREGLLCTTPAPAPPLCPMGAAWAVGTQATGSAQRPPAQGYPPRTQWCGLGPLATSARPFQPFFFFNNALIIILYICRDLEIIKHQSAGEQPR